MSRDGEGFRALVIPPAPHVVTPTAVSRAGKVKLPEWFRRPVCQLSLHGHPLDCFIRCVDNVGDSQPYLVDFISDETHNILNEWLKVRMAGATK